MSPYARVNRKMLKACFLFLCIWKVQGANILAVFGVPSVSHQVVYRALTLELNRRGHNLTVITPNPIKDPDLKNYREIDVSFQYELWNREMVANPKHLKYLNHFPEIFLLIFTIVSPKLCQTCFASPQVRDFINENPKFDLLITEFGYNPCMYAFVKFTGYRHVGITSFQTNNVVHENFGNLNTASYVPEVFFPHSDSMTFCQRVRGTMYQVFVWMTYAYTMWSQTLIARKYFGTDLPHLVDVERNLSALLVNSHFSMFYPRPYLPNLVEIGGPAFHLNNRKSNPLPKVNFISENFFFKA